MCNFERHHSPCSVESIVVEVGLSQFCGGDRRGANLSLGLTRCLFAVADAAAAATSLTTTTFDLLRGAIGLDNRLGDLLSDLMLLFLLGCQLLLDLNLSPPCSSYQLSISLLPGYCQALCNRNFLHPKPSGNDDCAPSLLDSSPPDDDHSASSCVPPRNQTAPLDPSHADYSPAANDEHASVALTSQPDGPSVLGTTPVVSNNHATSSCSSSQHNDPLLAQHMSPSSVGNHLSTPGHGCTTSCHLSPSDNDQLASSSDEISAPNGNSSASCRNSSSSGPPIASSPGGSGSPTGQNDKSTAPLDHNSALANHAHPRSSSGTSPTDGNHS